MVKNSPAMQEAPHSAEDMGSIPGSGRSPGEGNGSPLQYSCLGNPMDRGAWQTTVHGVAKVRYNLVTKTPPPLISSKICLQCWLDCIYWLFNYICVQLTNTDVIE